MAHLNLLWHRVSSPRSTFSYTSGPVDTSVSGPTSQKVHETNISHNEFDDPKINTANRETSLAPEHSRTFERLQHCSSRGGPKKQYRNAEPCHHNDCRFVSAHRHLIHNRFRFAFVSALCAFLVHDFFRAGKAAVVAAAAS